ncbi:hypothetical protein SAICODRAFT_87747 [Saitoella complicata NRRL Y-17804]|uniref:uncharacterized protein n=1 Tax=Saitoella complicata (strain BCRC 22490 / CBS 7301 / JCM 7358 / NBRC 10748 / NRRL Y-17804) TaxID=698492 RepID=UPI0008672752|nr:uncharacterized protein SAICODRAFT_87747 [Saitoella complicata NRRL Y-17804]ODQ55654.1 hypothetical protein SAICODRAFT_87747 [Saitoella complicata NRRL Y-17804]
MSQGGYVPQPSNSHVRKRSSPDDHDSHHSPHKRPISTPAYNMQGPPGYHQPPAPYPDARPVSGNPGGNPASYTYGSFDQPQGQYGGAYGQDTAPRNPNPYQSGPPPPASAPAPGPPPFAGNELAAPPSNSGAAWSSSSPVPPNGMNYYPQAAYSQAPMHPLQRPPPPPMPQFSNGLNPGMDPFGGQGGGEDEPAPVLFRTSTLSSKGQMPLSASTASALPPPPAPGANSNNPTDPNAPGWVYQGNKATLKIIGELDDMGSNWLPEEWATRRRLVQFWRQQKGNTINCTFRPVLPANRVPNSICVSCIWWEEKQDCFVTSVDCIYLLEALVGVRFTVEEKNRIRRNLEGFRPLTVSKTKPESEEFFKLIMGFPNPKPRNIEKDVKVFPWRILGGALKKIIGKYTIQSASYEGQEGVTPAPQQATPPAAYNNSQHGPPAPPQQQPFDGQPQYQPGPSPNMQQQHGSAPQSSQAGDNDSAHSVHSGHKSSSTSRPQSQAHYSPQQARQPPPKLQLEMPPPSNNAPPAVQPSASTLPHPQPSGQGNQLPVPGGNMSTLPSPNTYRLPFPAPIGAPGAARGSFDFSEFFSQSPATANPHGQGLGMSGMPPPTSASENDGTSNVRDDGPAKQEG